MSRAFAIPPLAGCFRPPVAVAGWEGPLLADGLSTEVTRSIASDLSILVFAAMPPASNARRLHGKEHCAYVIVKL